MEQSCKYLVILAFAAAIQDINAATEYYGRYIGPLSRLLHSVSGEVYAVDARTLHIRDFTYDGEGPAAFFYAGNSKAPGPGGFIVRDESGSNGVLKRYNKKHITLTLPEGKTLNSIRWFSVWCDEFQVNFGDIQIPRGLDFPKPQKIGALSGVHGVASENIVIVDAQTLLIPSFSYDGEAPDAKFWVGRGPKPSPQGIRVPDENGKLNPLRRYDRKTIVLTLPNDLTIFDIGHFGVWCEAFTVDFGHVQIPPALNVPPSLKMLGVSPQSKLNCEVLSDDLAFEVRWAVAGDSVVIQLVAKLEDGEYMSFGLSGDDRKSAMVGGDVVTAWVDQNTLNGYAHDYYLDSKSQCAGTRGSCPDYRIEPNTESVRLLNAALVNGYSIVTYQRPLKAHDGLDKPIFTNRSQPIIWAVGPLNSKLEVSYHSITSKGDVFLDFGRPPKWNCPIPESDATPDASSSASEIAAHESTGNHQRNPVQRATEPPAPVYKTPPPPAPAPKNAAWEIPPIQCNEPEDGVFYAQMGPTGGKHGYPAITGHVGWGISYYINGLLIPEIYVVRGRTYTFVVEGGKDPNIPAKYHPFYITDDPVGGYQHKTPEEKRKVNIYAGAELNKHGEVVPTGLGRLCNWTPDPDQPMADEFASFGAYQRTLTLVCDHGEPAVVQWTPDKDTPDTVYYQCFLHRYLGWKIHVLDRCDLPPDRNAAGSAPVPSVLLPEGQQQDELQAKPSIIVTTRVKPDFPSQSLTDTAFKNYTKMHFPYEILKPAYNVKRPNLSDEHIIPVKEDVEDIPDTSSTQKPNQSMNTTLNGATALPLIKGPQPHRNGYGNTGNMRLPTRRPVIMVRRPLQPMMKPHMNQHIPHMNRPMAFGAPSQNRPVIVKKPIMRLPQRPMMMQNLPARPMMPQQPSVMPNRAPVKAVYVHKFKKPIQQSFNTPLPEKTKFKMQPSQMISQSAEEITTRLPIAVNTGFNPGSLVIESGFKPIIQTPHAEDRLSEIEYEDSNEGVINVENLDEQKSHTEMFEPMFIPSPLDSNTKHTKKATTEPVKKIRKPYRQVIVRRPIYNDEPLFRSEPEEPIDKLKPYYLPSTRTTPSSSSSSTASDNDDKTSPIPANHKPERKDDLTTDKPVALPLKTDASEEITVDNKETKQEPIAQASDLEIVTVINVFKEERRQRKRRDAHHEPGHNEDNNQHDHSEHDHSQHDHAQHQANNTNNSNQITPFLCLTIFTTILAKFL